MEFRPFSFRDLQDAELVCRFIDSRLTFFHWSAGLLGSYPLAAESLLSRYADMSERLLLEPFIVYEDGIPVGHITLRRSGCSDDKRRIGFVLVNPDFRGRGIGRRMIRDTVDFSLARNPSMRLSIGVFLGNTAAYRCYMSLGFVEDMTSDQLISTPDGCDVYRICDYRADAEDEEKKQQ